jgi:hypothetical protein
MLSIYILVYKIFQNCVDCVHRAYTLYVCTFFARNLRLS